MPVKVRGYRVEPVEIEGVVRQVGGVKEAVVVGVGEGAERRLVCYIVVEEGSEVREEEIRREVGERMAGDQRPGVYVKVGEIPKRGSGKVDRKKVVEMEEKRIEEEWDKGEAEEEEGIGSETEREVGRIWGGVMKVARIRGSSNFFSLGGHSLLATQVMSRIRAAFKVDLPLMVLFERPTVAALAEAIDSAMREQGCANVPPISRASRESNLPLSFAQQRLWLLDQLEPGSGFYNIPSAIRIRGRLDIAALQENFDAVDRKNEKLVTT